MNEKKDEAAYPIKSLHDFLTELDKEWDKFRISSLIGMVVSGVLLIFLIIQFFRLEIFREILRLRLIGILDDFLVLFLVAAFLTYEISLLLRQYRFFSKWERRVGLLMHLEEELMEERQEEDKRTHDHPP